MCICRFSLSRDCCLLFLFFFCSYVFVQDTSLHQREALFQQKLKLCAVVFDMTDPMENSRWVEVRGSGDL